MPCGMIWKHSNLCGINLCGMYDCWVIWLLGYLVINNMWKTCGKLVENLWKTCGKLVENLLISYWEMVEK